jgi:HSP20 family protein
MKSEATVKAKVENLLKPIFVEAKELFGEIKKLEEAIAKRAYEFFEKRGGKHGNDLNDWFLAESELLKPVPIEIKDTEDIVTVIAEVPGFAAEDIKVSVEDNVLMINGKFTKTEEKKEEGKVVFSEIKSTQFLRELVLPAIVDMSKAEAVLKDGVLTLTLPKLVIAEKEKKEIEVKIV